MSLAARWRNQASTPSLGQSPPPLKNKKGGDVGSHEIPPGPAWAELPGYSNKARARQDKARARQAQGLPISPVPHMPPPMLSQLAHDKYLAAL